MLNQNMLLNAKNRVAINWTGSYSLSFSKSYGYAYDSIDTVSKPEFTSSYIYVYSRSYSPALLDGNRIPTNGTTGNCVYGEYWRSGRSATMSFALDTSKKCAVSVYNSYIDTTVYFTYSVSYSGFNYVSPSSESGTCYMRIRLKPNKTLSNTTTSATWLLDYIHSDFGFVSFPDRTSYYEGMNANYSFSTNFYTRSDLNADWVGDQFPHWSYVTWPSGARPSSDVTCYTGTATAYKNSYNGVAYSSIPSGCRLINTAPKFTLSFS